MERGRERHTDRQTQWTAYHHVYEAREAPESINLVLHDNQYWRQEVTHSLHIACSTTTTTHSYTGLSHKMH